MVAERIQLRRTKGYRKPEGAVVVSRPSKHGNPFPVHGDWIMTLFRSWATGCPVPLGPLAAPTGGTIEFGDGTAVAFSDHARGVAALGAAHSEAPAVPPPPSSYEELRGKDLACWCPLDQPCHADVLLELANS